VTQGKSFVTFNPDVQLTDLAQMEPAFAPMVKKVFLELILKTFIKLALWPVL
jgi:hypothetical protein